MICPDCGHDNLPGADTCDACGQPLPEAPAGSELEQTIVRHAIDVLVPQRPVTVSAETTVREAITTMTRGGFGCLIVESQGRPGGIFTERDVLTRIWPDLSRLDQPVGDFMTAEPVTVTGQDSIAYTMQSMDGGGYRHVPVVDGDGQVTGIVSVRDILRFFTARFGRASNA